MIGREKQFLGLFLSARLTQVLLYLHRMSIDCRDFLIFASSPTFPFSKYAIITEFSQTGPICLTSCTNIEQEIVKGLSKNLGWVKKN